MRQPKPKFVVGAYTPQGETFPVLLVTLDSVTISPVYRRGEVGYDLLKRACSGKPVWLFGEEAKQI